MEPVFDEELLTGLDLEDQLDLLLTHANAQKDAK